MGADGSGAGRCRHCLKAVAPDDRRRGLCRDCHATPAVRGRYQARTCRPGEKSHDGQGLTDAEVLALPPSWGDDQPPPPGEYVPEAEARKIGDLAEQWAGVGANGAFELHPDTEPAAIRAKHLAEVREAVGRLGRQLGRPPTAAEVADDLYMAEWSVERLMAQLE